MVSPRVGGFQLSPKGCQARGLGTVIKATPGLRAAPSSILRFLCSWPSPLVCTLTYTTNSDTLSSIRLGLSTQKGFMKKRKALRKFVVPKKFSLKRWGVFRNSKLQQTIYSSKREAIESKKMADQYYGGTIVVVPLVIGRRK